VLSLGGSGGSGAVSECVECGGDGCALAPLTVSGSDGELSLKVENDEADLGPFTGDEKGFSLGALIFKGVLGLRACFNASTPAVKDSCGARNSVGEDICAPVLRSSTGGTSGCMVFGVAAVGLIILLPFEAAEILSDVIVIAAL
jgi:hypothetical protein